MWRLDMTMHKTDNGGATPRNMTVIGFLEYNKKSARLMLESQTGKFYFAVNGTDLFVPVPAEDIKHYDIS